MVVCKNKNFIYHKKRKTESRKNNNFWNVAATIWKEKQRQLRKYAKSWMKKKNMFYFFRLEYLVTFEQTSTSHHLKYERIEKVRKTKVENILTENHNTLICIPSPSFIQ